MSRLPQIFPFLFFYLHFLRNSKNYYIKKYISNVQNEVSSIDIDENDNDEKKENKKVEKNDIK